MRYHIPVGTAVHRYLPVGTGQYDYIRTTKPVTYDETDLIKRPPGVEFFLFQLPPEAQPFTLLLVGVNDVQLRYQM